MTGQPKGNIDSEHLELRQLLRADDYEGNSRCPSSRGEEDVYDKPNKTTVRFVMTFIGFSMAFIGSQLVGLLFAAITTTIAYELQAGSKFVWLFSASLIGSIAAAPFAGPLADLVGRKTISVVGVSASLLGMVLCGATNHVDGFIAGQVLVGAGVAIQELMSLCVIVELVPARRRGFYVALSISALIPFTPGPMYGQMIAQYNWRWNTLLVGIWNALTIAIILIFYQPPPRVNSFGLRRLEIVKRIDFLGGFLMAAGTLLFALGLNWGGQEYPWRSAQVICILVLSLVVFFAFGVWEVFGAKWPMYPRRVAQGRRAFFAIIFIIFVAGITYMPALIFWVMQIISVYDSSPAEVGVRILPFGICILSGSIICALLISAFKDHIRPLQVAFCALQTIGIGCMAAVDPHNINTAWAPLIIGLIGVGGVLVPSQTIITIITPDDLMATATSLGFCVRAIGQVVGLSIFHNRFLSLVTHNAEQFLVPVAMDVVGINDTARIEGMLEMLTGISFTEFVAAGHLPEVDTVDKFSKLAEAVVETFGRSFPGVYLITIAFGVSACIASVFMRDMSKYMDDHVAVRYD